MTSLILHQAEEHGRAIRQRAYMGVSSDLAHDIREIDSAQHLNLNVRGDSGNLNAPNKSNCQ